jgi:hypothetical protein
MFHVFNELNTMVFMEPNGVFNFINEPDLWIKNHESFVTLGWVSKGFTLCR